MMNDQVEIFKAADNQVQVLVYIESETVWLNRQQMAILFDRDIKTIGKHIANIFTEGELERKSVVANFATTAADGKSYQVEHYNLDVIISVGYRVKSVRGTQFRQWATRRLRDYLVEGYAINQKRLEERNIELRHLKTGISILHRAIEQQAQTVAEAGNLAAMLEQFSTGLLLLDDYDHETLDSKGKTSRETVRINKEQYLILIDSMRDEFSTDVFALPKDESFDSSINQIYQSFGGAELYPSLEEKAAMLLYFIVKNHSFVDGNKRIAAACFLYFLDQNGLLRNTTGDAIISNEALAAITLFIAVSKPDEMETVKNVVISILNRRYSFTNRLQSTFRETAEAAVRAGLTDQALDELLADES
jgi:prophage maintenance system killer protein